MKPSRIMGLLALALLAACQRGPESSPAAGAAPGGQPAATAATALSPPQGIAWIEGDVERALADAKAEGKLVFLYWGAEWCPPCHDLKAHVFSRRDFQQKIRQFVAVHLDGDAPGAQRLAGEFQVMGYPTAVVLRPDRTEVARIAGGMDLTRYADVLDLALEGVRPLPELLASLRGDGTRRLDATDCRRMAYNGWTLDPLAAAQPQALVESLSLAALCCPEASITERDRLVLTAAAVAAGPARQAVEGGGAAGARMPVLVDAVADLLAERGRALDNADALLALDEDFFVVLRRLRPARVTTVQADWYALMDALEADPRFADTERLMSAAGRLMVAKAFSPEGRIPDAVAAQARRTVDAFLAAPRTPDARAGIVNSASWALLLLGDDARLRKLLEGELATSRTPYYYMPDLADLDEKAGRRTEALAWLARGYRESQGPATRFQWGALYVQGLLRISPEDETRVRDATLAVLGELDGPYRVHARARARVEKLAQGLRGWATTPSRRTALQAVQARWQKLCSALPADDPARSDCAGLLGPAGA